MRRAIWVLAAALPLAAQPKLLTNAQVDTRSAAGTLEPVFQQFVAAQPQPAWIGYAVAAAGGGNFGCPQAVVHLEPPAQMVVLFRVEGAAVNRIRVLPPDCEIDAGGVPVHWLSEVRPADSAALLGSFALKTDLSPALRDSAIRALSVSKGAEAVDALISVVRQDRNSRTRRQAISALSRSEDPRAQEFFKEVLK